MLTWMQALGPLGQALLAGTFTWSITALGAATVIFARRVPPALFTAMMGFAGGVMLAVSYWSLLQPSVSLARSAGLPSWLPAAVGFVGGALMVGLIDRLLPHVHPVLPFMPAEGLHTRWRQTTLLVLAITLHNVPEGLAVGVAFGAAATGVRDATFGAAVALAFGIGLQNLPEGVAVSMPLRAAGTSRLRSFWIGSMSAVVEPIAAVAGAAAVLWVRPLMPYALAFAAGAMLFVVVEEVIPEAQQGGRQDLATASIVAGFTIMMILDVAFG
jgi:ZIP family zinc transporter